MDLHLSISDGFVKTKIFDKRNDFGFEILNFPFLDGEVPRSHPIWCLYFFNLFVVLECPFMSITLIFIIKF